MGHPVEYYTIFIGYIIFLYKSNVNKSTLRVFKNPNRGIGNYLTQNLNADIL